MSLKFWRRIEIMKKGKKENLLGYEIKIIPDKEPSGGHQECSGGSRSNHRNDGET
jgi:hypothetical protein